MKIKGNDVLNYTFALNRILNKDMPGKLALAVVNNAKILEDKETALRMAIQKTRQKYAKKDDDGEFAISNDRYVYAPEDEANCNIELTEMGEQEIEIPDFMKVDIALFEKCNDISPADILALEFMIQ